MTIQRKVVGERLRHYREACALSQQQVADALNIERSTYTKYETGGTEPNLKMIVRIAAIYNVSPVELLPTDVMDSPDWQALKDSYHADSPIYQLSKDERGLVALYRAMSKEDKRQVREFLENLSKKRSDNPVK